MSTTKSWEDLVARARAQNAEKAKAVSNSDTGSLATTKSWDDLVARARKQNAEKRQKEQQKLMQSNEYKWATENAKRLKNGLNLNINNGQIYTFEPLTADVLQSSIDVVDSEIEKLKAQGVSSNMVWNMFTGVANNSEAAQQLRELENQRSVYSKYLQNVEYEDAMAEIDKNGDSELFSELYSIDSRKKTLLDALGNIGSGGNLLPTNNADDLTREAEIKTALQEKYGDNFEKYRDIYAQGKNDKIKSQLVQKMQETVDEHPFLGTVGYTLSNVATAPVRGIAALSDSINKAAGNYGATSGSDFQEVSDATVQKVDEEINNKFENQYAAGFVRTLYNAAVSGAESMLTMGTFGKLGEAVLGLNAATSTYKSAKERGLSEGLALANGIAAGIFETLFEHFSLDQVRIFKALPSTSLKPFIQNVLKQAAVEGGEEVATDLANEAYDYLVNGGLSQYEQALQNGMTAGEYAKQFISQLGETFFTGALSGGGMIGVSAAPNAVRGSMINALEDVQQGQQISRFKNLHNDVLSDAKESGSVLRKKAEKAEKRIADGKGISYRKLGEINRKVIKKQRESDIDKILSSKDYKELSGKEKNALRSSVLTHLNDAKIVSPEQQDVLNTENAKQILKEMQSLEYRRMEERDNKRIAETEKQSEIQKKTIGKIRTAVAEKNTESLVKNTFTAKHKDGYEVNIGAVKNISNGELEIVQDNETGATAKLSELNIKDAQARELYSNLQTLATGENPLTVEAINVALSMYNTLDNTSARAYALWVHDAYKAGALNMKNTVLSFSEFEEMFRNKYEADITEAQLREIYEVGARNLVTKPGVTRIGHKGLSKFQAEQVFILSERAKKLGLELVLTDGRLTDDDGKGVNALYIEGTNRIVMSLQNDLGLTLVHAGHEIFHYAKNQSAEIAQNLQDTVINLLKSDSKYDFDGIYKHVSAEYDGLSENAILEEIAAQYLGVVFASEDNIRKTVATATTEQKRFLKRMVKYLKDFVKSLKELIKIYGDSDKTVRAAVETPVEQLQNIADKFDKVLKETAENKKAATEPGGVKASLKMSENVPTVEQIAEVRRIGRKSINAFTSEEIEKTQYWAKMFWEQVKEKSPFFRAWFGDWRAYDTNKVPVLDDVQLLHFSTRDEAEKHIKDGIKNRTLFRGDVKNADTGFVVNVGSQVYNDALTYANRKFTRDNDLNSYLIRLSILENIQKIVEKSILLDTEVAGNDKNIYKSFVHKFYTLTQVNGGQYLVKLTVDELSSSAEPIRRAYNVNSIKITPIAVSQVYKPAGTMGVNGELLSNISISELFDIVKKYDAEFKPNPVNTAFLNEDGTPKLFYHGTNAKWTEYDLSKNVNQMWGEGIYLTPDYNRAKLYGDNVMSFYVRALVNNRTAKATGQTKDHTIMKNGDVLVYSPEQIKSATDNIGTFDKTKKDIRYSKSISKDVQEKVINDYGIQNLNDPVEVQIKVFSTLQQKGFFTNDNKTSRIDINEESGMVIETNRSGINETFSYKNFARNGKETKMIKLATVSMLPDIIREAKVLEDGAPNVKNSNSSATYAYLMGDIIIDGVSIEVKVTVRKSPRKNKFWVHHIYIKNDTAVASGEHKNSESPALQTNGAEESVTQQKTEVKEKYSRQIINDSWEDIRTKMYENEVHEDIIEEIESYVQGIANRKLARETAITEGIIPKYEAILKITRKYTKGSDVSANELADTINELMWAAYDGNLDTKQFVASVKLFAEDILRTGKKVNDEMYRKYADFRKLTRETTVFVDQNVYNHYLSEYGSKKNLNRACAGKIKIKPYEDGNSTGRSLDNFYSELKERFPELMYAESDVYRQLFDILDAWQTIQPWTEYYSDTFNIRTKGDLHHQALVMSEDILSEVLGIKETVKTIADKYSDNLKNQQEHYKEYYRKQAEEGRRKRRESEQKEVYVKRIIRITRRLDKLLRKETDHNHIPEDLKQPVAKFLQIIKGSITNSFGESLVDGALTMAELNKAYEAYGYEDTMHSDESYAEKLSQLQFVLHGDKRLKDLSLNELETVEEIVTHFNFLVNEGNKTFVDTQKRGYEHVASVSTEELFAHKENRKKGLEKIKDAEYHMLTPYYFFKMIGTRFEGSEEVTEILGELGNALLKGEEKTARNAEKIKEITQQIMSKHGYDSRWLSDKKDYVLKSGQKVSMTTENIMHMLATYDREKASGFKTDHIFAGGIVVNETTHKTASDYIIKPIPKAIKTRHAFNKVQKERKERLKNNGEKIFVGMTDSERAKLLKETALSVVDATNVSIEEDVVGQVMELKKECDGSAFKVVRKLAENYGVFKDYLNENIRLDFNYSVGSIKKSINEAEKNGEDINDFAKMLSVFDDVVKNAQLVEVHEDKYNGTKKENTNLAQVYVLMSAFQDGNNLIPVEFVVKEFKKGVKNQLYVSVNLKRIEAEVPKAVEPKSPDAFRPTSVYRIADIISKVNPFDIEFLKYIPASMLDAQQVVGRNEGIRKERLRVADVARTGEIALKEKGSEDEQKILADKIAESMRVNISPADIDMLRSQLTPQQTAYYKALVKAMSKDGADMGNETSMMLFGTKKFTEENYCPVSVVSDYLLERFGSKDIGERRLKNRSFTKRVTENANAPILIDNMSEVYAKHMYEMCTYNGMTIPLESIERLLNYKLPDEYEAVGDKIQVKKGKSYRELFREAFGDRAIQYLENLMKDLNGGIKVDNRGALNSMISNFKRSAVSASLTVAMQQPGAVGRAMLRINPQYFTPTVYLPFPDKVTKVISRYTGRGEFLDRYDELLKYCPLAVIKDVGKFDTNVGQSFEDWILDIKPKFHSDKSIKGVVKGLDMWLPGAKGKLEDAMMWLPGYLDRATWLHIWNAVKRETAHKNGVKVSKLSEKMLTQAGERMSQVIRETQVYDSVLSRSDLMRSKSALAQMATSFMAEPTVTYNMMRYAAVTAKHQPKVFIRAIASVLCSIVLTDLLKNFAEAVRYDDEETDFAELMISGTVVEFINDLNPLTYIPYVKDIWSMFEGYDIERVDMSVFSKVIDALKPFMDSEKEAGYEEWEQLIVTLSMFTGIPVNNLWKDITGIKAKFKKGSPKFSIDAVENSIKSELSENPFIKLAEKIFPPIYYFFDMSDEKIIYNAILNDDEAVLDRYRLTTDEDVEDIINKGYSEADAQLKATDNTESNFHSKVVNGLVSEDIRIKEAAEARLESDTEVYEELLEELTELGFDRNDVIKAVDKYIASMEDKTYEASEKKDKPTYTYDDLYRAIDSRNMTAAKVIFDSLTEEKEIDTVRNNIKKEYADDIYNAIRKKNNTEKQRLINMFDAFDYDYHYAVILGLQENDNRVKEAAEARYTGKYSLYESKSAEIINDGFSENDVYSAIEKETAKLAPEEDDSNVSSPETNYQYEYSDIHKAIDKNDLAGVEYVVAELKESGVKADNIKSSLNGKYRDKYIKAWQTGDDDTIQRLRTLLTACDVGFTNKTFAAWEKAANEK